LSRGWLIVFAKAPRPGLVKTRMSPPFSLEESAALYQEMLADVLAATARFSTQLGLEPVVAFHPPDAINEVIGHAPPGFRFQAQRGEGLGDRMAHAVAEAAAAGAKCVLIRGSDSPALPFACFEEAVERLEAGDDVVLTPDQSGGYALIGMKQTERRLFEIPMSTEAVLDQTLEFARELHLSASTTQAAFDLNTVGDLQLLEALSEEETTDLCPRTVQFLSTIPGRRVL
jgi:rSAM/selenodomain-associated transferase 1